MEKMQEQDLTFQKLLFHIHLTSMQDRFGFDKPPAFVFKQVGLLIADAYRVADAGAADFGGMGPAAVEQAVDFVELAVLKLDGQWPDISFGRYPDLHLNINLSALLFHRLPPS